MCSPEAENWKLQLFNPKSKTEDNVAEKVHYNFWLLYEYDFTFLFFHSLSILQLEYRA